jgi:hypothetical protein
MMFKLVRGDIEDSRGRSWIGKVFYRLDEATEESCCCERRGSER